jgi:hypothetical protein
VAAWCIVAIVGLGGLPLVATECSGGASPRLYTVAATKACLSKLPDAISGLPPATPPRPPALFVYSFQPDRLTPRAHGQLGAWYGLEGEGYEGMTLTFFKSRRDARASRKSLVWLYGGKLARNVVVAWDGPVPRARLRKTVFDCFRGELDAGRPPAPQRPTPQASLATFAGYWGGHTRGLRITSNGRGVERVNSGCCFRLYDMTFQIRSVSGTLTRATAVYRVTSYKRHERDLPSLTQNQVGKLVLRNGIVTNTLTEVYFCSNPAWGATGACGA